MNKLASIITELTGILTSPWITICLVFMVVTSTVIYMVTRNDEDVRHFALRLLVGTAFMAGAQAILKILVGGKPEEVTTKAPVIKPEPGPPIDWSGILSVLGWSLVIAAGIAALGGFIFFKINQHRKLAEQKSKMAELGLSVETNHLITMDENGRFRPTLMAKIVMALTYSKSEKAALYEKMATMNKYREAIYVRGHDHWNDAVDQAEQPISISDPVENKKLGKKI